MLHSEVVVGRGVHLALFLALAASSAPAARTTSSEDSLLDQLFAGYAAGDHLIIRRTLNNSNYSKVLKSLIAARERWGNDRRPTRIAFLFDLAIVEADLGGLFETFDIGQKYVRRRPQPLGRDPKSDALELAWHRGVAAFMEHQRRPSILQRLAVEPLKQWMSAIATAAGDPTLVDPWVALTLGIAEEQWTVADPSSLAKRGAAALTWFDEATKHESTRPEALVRKSWLLVRLGRSTDALAALDAFGDRSNDIIHLYWSRLFRGRALEAAGRMDDAAKAYRSALTFEPHAQAPAVALAALETRRGQPEEAQHWAFIGRTTPVDAIDPWWLYGSGDFRFFTDRLNTLRELGRQ